MVDACGNGARGMAPAHVEKAIKSTLEKYKPLDLAKAKIEDQMIKARGYTGAPTDLNPVVCQEKDAGYTLKIGTNFWATLETSEKFNYTIKSQLLQHVDDLNKRTQHEVAVEQLTKQILQGGKSSFVHSGIQYKVKTDGNKVVSLDDKKLDAPDKKDLKKEILNIIDEANTLIQTKFAENQIMEKVKIARSLATAPSRSAPMKASFSYFQDKVPIEIMKEENQYFVELDEDNLKPSAKLSLEQVREIANTVNFQLSQERGLPKR